MNSVSAFLMPRRLFLGYGLFALLLVAIAIGAFETFTGMLANREINRLNAVADLKSGEIQNWWSERRADGQVLASSSLLPDFFAIDPAAYPNHPVVRKIQHRLDTVRTAYDYAGIELFDRSGKRDLSSGMPLNKKLGPKDYASQMDPHRRVAMVDFHRSSSGIVHLSVLAEVRDSVEDNAPLIG